MIGDCTVLSQREKRKLHPCPRLAVLLAGPNGAGTIPFINGFLRERAEAIPVVNPDAASLSRRERA
jgi:hypothetical protein